MLSEIGHYFVVLSNIAYLAPAILAFRRGFPRVGVAASAMIFISGIYHYIKIVGGAHVDALWFLDHMYSVYTFVITAGTVLYPVKHATARVFAAINDVGLPIFISAALYDGYGTDTVILASIAIVFIIGTVAALTFKVRALIDIVDILFGVFLISMAAACYVMASRWEYYYLHSAWHVLTAATAYTSLEAIERRSNLFSCLDYRSPIISV